MYYHYAIQENKSFITKKRSLDQAFSHILREFETFQIKLKRKVDLCSVEILDKSTTQQGGEILDLYRPSQKKIIEVNNYDESEDVSDTLLQRTISSTIPEQQFDLEKLREEICEEIREEIRE
uniref:Uncharacterized protein n=1 Tax=Rhizophagus irregularis (strain DAOM 181602 / DAOM 197198 / MUCL 43194) TaxID=747089 RepID=U9UJK2_RHIID